MTHNVDQVIYVVHQMTYDAGRMNEDADQMTHVVLTITHNTHRSIRHGDKQIQE